MDILRACEDGGGEKDELSRVSRGMSFPMGLHEGSARFLGVGKDGMMNLSRLQVWVPP